MIIPLLFCSISCTKYQDSFSVTLQIMLNQSLENKLKCSKEENEIACRENNKHCLILVYGDDSRFESQGPILTIC